MNTPITEEAVLDKLRKSPPERLAQVADFIDFLAAAERRRAALGRLLETAPALEAAGTQPITDEEIVAEVKAVRAERRAQRERANRP